MSRIRDPGQLGTCGLHWFEVEFEERRGNCFITTGEALRLRQLSETWVERALHNLASKRGWDWVSDAACSGVGLMLHDCDAYELSGS